MGAASGRRVAEATRQGSDRPRRYCRSSNLSAARLAAAALVLLILAAACTGDDDSSSDTRRPPRSSNNETRATTTTTTPPDEPSADKPLDVAPVLQDLLDHYDEVVTKIVADPSVVNDPTDPLVEEFLSLFEVGSQFAQGSLDGWAKYAQDGTTVKPLVANYPINVTRLEGPPHTIGEDEVSFGQCTTLNLVTYKNGQEQQRFDRTLLPGDGRAVRVENHWLLVDISTPEDTKGCFQGSGVPR